MRLEKCTLKAVTDNAFYLTSMQIPFILMHVYTIHWPNSSKYSCNFETSFNVNCQKTIEMNAVIVRFSEIKEFIMSGQ